MRKSMHLDIIFIIGPQGSGKGTQAEILAKRLGFSHWNMGAILREEHDHKFPTGETVGELIDKGVLLNYDQLMEVFGYRAKNIPTDRGVIFDGVPRTLDQAKLIMDFLSTNGRKDFLTIFLDIPEEETMKRLLLRAKKEERVDDTPEAIQFRIDQYERDTKPVLEYLKENTTFIEIDGRPSIEEVTKSITAALGLA